MKYLFMVLLLSGCTTYQRCQITEFNPFGPDVCPAKVSCANHCGIKNWTPINWTCEDGKQFNRDSWDTK